MIQDLGPQASVSIPVSKPLPLSWLGRADAPLSPPIWANIGSLSSVNVRNLLSQIAYDQSSWDYSLIGPNNQLGRYQFTTQELENYGLVEPGSNQSYGIDSVNYLHVWSPIKINNGINNYQNYFYNISSLYQFLSVTVAQEHLAYQKLVDLYKGLLNNGAINTTDTIDVVAGMIYVGWTLGVGSATIYNQPQGSGAWAWRYFNVGNGAGSYNSGRYAVTVL